MDRTLRNKPKNNLSLLQYQVTQEGATEPPFSHKGFEQGTKIFVCVCCGSKLFKIEKFAFFEPKLSSRKVILLSFKNSILTKKETFSQRDTKIIEISTKKVISGGRKLTVLQQIFGNIGNFSSQKFQQD